MGNGYIICEGPHKEFLDTIKVGDLVKCNDWKQALRVVAVSRNFFIMVRRAFNRYIYSICHKNDADVSRNLITAGMPYVGTDNYVFGFFESEPDHYNKTLKELEKCDAMIAENTAATLFKIQVKHVDKK